jgi:tRNA A58 N-methylase Trm61
LFFLREENVKGRFLMISNLVGKTTQLVIFESNEDTINLALKDLRAIVEECENGLFF